MVLNPRKHELSWETREVPKRRRKPDVITFRDFTKYLSRIFWMEDSEFKQYIRTLTDVKTRELHLLYHAFDHEKQRILLEEGDVEVAAKVFSSLEREYEMQATISRELSEAAKEVFLDLSNERRREIANKWSEMERKMQVLDLNRLRDSRFELVQFGGMPSRFIMTEPLPASWPKGMDTCYRCGNRYVEWDVFTVRRCKKHTNCSTCASYSHVCYPGSAY
jgi:hypothetical protein